MTKRIDTFTVVEEVRDYILQNILLGVTDVPLDEGDSFLQRGILDSTGVLELVGFLEERYGITFADKEIAPENLDSLNAIGAYVLRKLNQS